MKELRVQACFGKATDKIMLNLERVGDCEGMKMSFLLLESCHAQHRGLSSQVSVETASST